MSTGHHPTYDTQGCTVSGGPTFHPSRDATTPAEHTTGIHRSASHVPTPIPSAPNGTTTYLDEDFGPVDDLPTSIDHASDRTNTRPDMEESTPEDKTSDGAQPIGRHQTRPDTHRVTTTDDDTRPGPVAKEDTTPASRSLLDPALSLAADILDDLERARLANQSRLRQLTRSTEDADGITRGFGLDETHPDVARLAAIVDLLTKAETDAVKNLEKMLRRHPLWTWINTTRGVGAKQGARLLVAIGGDPYMNLSTGQPRTVSALWAYCGLHTVPTDQRTPDTQTNIVRNHNELPTDQVIFDTRTTHIGGGEQPPVSQTPTDTPWAPTDGKLPAGQLKAGTHEPNTGGNGGGHPDQGTSDTQVLCNRVAARRVKGQRANWSSTAKSRARLVAEKVIQCNNPDYRAVYDARRVHTMTTHPQWTKGHSHNDALRVVAKTILRDLWRAARNVHAGFPPCQPLDDNQHPHVPDHILSGTQSLPVG